MPSPPRPSAPRALLLLPMQAEFREDVGRLRRTLQRAGYRVDVVTGREVTAARLRGDSLSRYRLVYLSTHGGVGTLMTGEDWRGDIETRGADPRLFVHDGYLQRDPSHAIADVEVGPYWALSGARFDSTIFVFGSCESAVSSQSRPSVLETAVRFGAPAAFGWNTIISQQLAHGVAPELIEALSRGTPPRLAVQQMQEQSRSLRHLRRWVWSYMDRRADVRELRALSNPSQPIAADQHAATVLSTRLRGR